MSRTIFACLARVAIILPLAFGLAAPAAQASTPAVDHAKPTKKKAKKKEAAAPATSSEDDSVPDTASAKSVDYKCDQGNSLTLYHHAEDQQHVALRWKNRLLQMTRIDTSTGANRYENTRAGLVWIGIPAKGILLDAKKGQQLANECKNAEQIAEAAEAGKPVLAPAAPAATTAGDKPATDKPAVDAAPKS